MQQFDAAAASRIADVVRELEQRSAVELVVEVRARSGSYAHADARFAAALVFVSLVVLVFTPITVSAARRGLRAPIHRGSSADRCVCDS